MKSGVIMFSRLWYAATAAVFVIAFSVPMAHAAPSEGTAPASGAALVISEQGELAAPIPRDSGQTSVAWRDADGDGDLDLFVTVSRGDDLVTRVYRNDGGPIFKAVTACTTVNGITTCEGDVSGGIRVPETGTSSTAIQIIVQNLTKDITPISRKPGVEAAAKGGNGSNGGAYQNGGGGVAGPAVTVKFLDTGHAVVTQGGLAHGIVARSEGGKGGNGGNSYVITNAGDGGNGGNGGAITIVNRGSLTTHGDSAAAIFVQSVGGNGGSGGTAYGIGAKGTGGYGGSGGAIDITNEGALSTDANRAYGILAQSLGGSSGPAGDGIGITWGGGSNAAGAGGSIQITNSASIATKGVAADGISAQSIGGFGASAGGGYVISVGGVGGSGGNGGAVTIANSGHVSTGGDSANAITAQSIGGGGGNGGGGWGIGLGGHGAGGGHGGKVTVTNSGTVETHGTFASAILAQSIGGGGGNGGQGGFLFIGGNGENANHGAAVRVENSGTITTTGARSEGILAQSIGGGGGNGGDTNSRFFGIGGHGGKGGNGDSVIVTQSGSIATKGKDSNAITAQSIGGGGGNGGSTVSVGLYVNVSVGGSAGDGGKGGVVKVTANDGSITTEGANSFGIQAQSIGGGGGNGGFAFSAAAGDKGAVSVGVGGTGGKGGNASNVSVTTDADITTGGSSAHGILAESIGGGGGTGGAAVSLAVAGGPSAGIGVGGSGEGGGAGANVSVLNTGSITTTGFHSYGILAQSVGGGGGDGGMGLAGSVGSKFTASAGFGGSAANGGSAGNVTVDTRGSIETKGAESHAIMAQSVGGGGGTGGVSGTLAASDKLSLTANFGGSGGKGGVGGVVTVLNSGGVATSGTHAYGIMAQSVGGGGGSGGGTYSVGGLGGKTAIGFDLGGSGGVGRDGNDVRISNSGTVLTTGNASHGIFAQSIGGGGGDGGSNTKIALPSIGSAPGATSGRGPNVAASLSGASPTGQAEMSTSVDVNVTVGGKGGSAANGGVVAIENSGSIVTKGTISNGIFAQSVGGGGGSAGTSAELGLPIPTGGGGEEPTLALGFTLSIGRASGNAGHGDSVRVANSGSIETSGALSHGIFAQSVGGGGGSQISDVYGPVEDILKPAGGASISFEMGGKNGTSGSGGAVDITNSGAIVTHDESSYGIFAQSVGKGGGQGGLTELDLRKGSITLGGEAGGSGNGGTVRVTNSGTILTQGKYSYGIFAQSVGGGGGLEVGGLSNSPLGEDPLAGSGELNISIGGNGANAGYGDKVAVSNSGDIGTEGTLSHAIYAQSVGGGGGQGATVDAGLISQFSLGGNGGASGNGGAVAVTNSGTVLTKGDAAYGIFAQSVGGGGGVGGEVKRGLGFLNVGIGIGLGGAGTNSGNGGAVTIANNGDITTLGDASIGIFAQSVGGGGGLGGGAGNANSPFFGSFAGSAGGSGRGGTVSVDQKGDIETYGDASHGIFAQSVGGSAAHQGMASDVDVTVDGNILLHGEDANGVMAQSVGGVSNGDITVEVKSGTIQGGAGESAGILILDGAENSITNHGTITTLDMTKGFAIRGTLGDDFIDNFGTIAGSIDLGDGLNAFTNEAGARFDAGTTVDLGVDGVFTNAGTFSPGGAGASATTTLGCDFVQTSTGTFEASVCGTNTDQLIVTNGTATLDGTLELVANCDKYVDGTTFDLIQASGVSGSFDEVVLPHTAFLDFTLDDTADGVTVSVDVTSFADAGKNPVECSIGSYLDQCLSDASGDMAYMIGSFQLATADQIAEAYATLSPDTYDNLTRGSWQGIRLYQDALAQRMDAARSNPFPGRETPGGLAFEGGHGVWLSGGWQGADQDESGGYLKHNFTTSLGLGGYEHSFGRSILGVSFGMAKTDVDRDNKMATGNVDGYSGAVYGGHIWGRTFAHGVVSYASTKFKNERDVHVGLEERIARGDFNGSAFSALVTGGRRLDAGRWAVEPFASVRYATLSSDRFTEQGAGSVNLIIDSRSSSQMNSDLGVRFSRAFTGERSAFMPELILSWNHDFGLDDREVVAAFAGDPSMTFTVTGQDVTKDGGTAGIGLNYVTTAGWKANLRFDHEQRSDFSANSLSIRLGSSF